MRTPAGLTNAGYLHMSIPHAAGALYSTTHDLLKWEQALFAGRIVSKASLDRMITPFKNDYAPGLTSALVNSRRVIAHGGGIDGFNTHLAYYPESRTVVIVLSNVNGTVPEWPQHEGRATLSQVQDPTVRPPQEPECQWNADGLVWISEESHDHASLGL